MSGIPTLLTDRLVLRAPSPDDFDAALARWREAEVIRYTTGRPAAPEEAWRRILGYIGHWTAFGWGFWTVADAVTGEAVGEVGFADFHRAIEPSFGATPEMGWVFTTAAHGRGLATEAVAAALRWGDAHLPGEETVCIIAPDNAASLRVAAKVGYRERRRTLYHDAMTIVLHRPRDA